MASPGCIASRTPGAGPGETDLRNPGVNHTVFLTHAYHDGHDVFPLIDAWIENEAPSYWETCPPSDDLGPVAVDLYRRFGVFNRRHLQSGVGPGPGTTDAQTERRWHEDGRLVGAALLRGAERVVEIERAALDATRPVSEVFPPEHSGEVMVPMIESIACDVPRVLIGNVLNGDFVPGIPRDFAVEIPTLVSRRGSKASRQGDYRTPCWRRSGETGWVR